MSISHHSEDPESRAAFDRFLKQITGDKSRDFPQGRISGEDDGATAYAIAADPKNKVILIRFPKPMDWIGLGIPEARQLIEALQGKITQLEQL